MTDQEKAIAMVYESVKKRLPVTLAQFSEALKDWTFIPLAENGEIIGAVMQKENELHIGYGKQAKTSILRHIRQPLKDAIEKYGFAKTAVQKGNERGLKFCKRLNFVEIGEDSGKILLRCDRSKYA